MQGSNNKIILDDCQNRHKKIYIDWIDHKKAFGRVPHKLMLMYSHMTSILLVGSPLR